jgi:hypothetical protein
MRGIRLSYIALALLIIVCAYASSIEFWGVSIRFNFGLPSRPFVLSARALDSAVTITATDLNNYNIQFDWSNAYYKDYVELNLSFMTTINVTLGIHIYTVSGLAENGYLYVVATSYCYVKVPGFIYSPNGCLNYEVTLLRANGNTDISYTVNGYPGGYLILRIRINNWGTGTGYVKLGVSASV